MVSAAEPAGKNAEATMQPTGSACRLCTLVLAKRSTPARSPAGSRAYTTDAALIAIR
jgi:hypothetical protein